MTSWEQHSSQCSAPEPVGLADSVAAVFLPWLYPEPGPEPPCLPTNCADPEAGL